MRMIGATALALLAACEAEEAEPPAAQDGQVKAAALLTADEIGQALGEPVGPPATGLDQEGLSQASWSTEKLRRTVSLMVRTGGGPAWSGEGLRNTVREAGTPIEDVPGLGRDAFWSAGSLHVVDDRGRTLILMYPEGPEARTKAAALMRKALARMGGP